MYEGNNPTALHSREWLVDALLALMEEKAYSGITIKDICGRAGLSRQTFYNFFDGKDSIIRFCIHRCYSEMMKSLAEKCPVKLADITEQLMETLYQNRKLMERIVAHRLDYFLELELALVIRVFAGQISPDAKKESDRYATAFLTGAVAHMILYWFKDEKPMEKQQLSALLCSILSGGYYQIQNEYLQRME